LSRGEEESTHRARGYRLIMVMPLAGFFSGLLTIALEQAIPVSFYFLGAVFGALLGICFAIVGVLNRRQAAKLVLVAAVAYFLSVFAGWGAQLALSAFGLLTPDEQWSMGGGDALSPVALFIAGLAGAFLMIGGTLSVVRPELIFTGGKAIRWSPLGGVLALIGWALGPSLGVALWNTFHQMHLTGWTTRPQDASPGLDYSLPVVWQTGMAFAIVFILRRYDAQPQPNKPKQT